MGTVRREVVESFGILGNIYPFSKKPPISHTSDCHSHENGNQKNSSWIPTFVGITYSKDTRPIRD